MATPYSKCHGVDRVDGVDTGGQTLERVASLLARVANLEYGVGGGSDGGGWGGQAN